MIIFRFLPFESALRTLETKTLRLGRFSEFNDPFEGFPSQSELVGVQGILRTFHEEAYLKALDSSKGILCFAGEDTISKPLLWSHYAEKHKGIALGFKTYPTGEKEHRIAAICGAQGGVPILDVRPVEYGPPPCAQHEQDANRRVNIPELDQLAGTYDSATCDDINRIIDKVTPGLMGRKGWDWGYEQEWRAIFPLRFADFRGGHYLVPIEKLQLCSIVLGWRCGLEDCCAPKLAESWTAKVYRARPDPNRFSLILEKLDE